MKDHPYLTFTLNDSIYGIDTFAVEEIFFLPELTPIPEAPRDIIGVVNVRGEILPVMDINLRFGYHEEDHHITDSVIVLKSDNLRVGIIVNQVEEVKNIEDTAISEEISIGRDSIVSQRRKFISGIARKDENIIVILDSNHLIHYIEKQEITQDLSDLSQDNINEDYLALEKRPVFCPNATSEEREIYRQRANNLRQTTETEEKEGYKPLAIIALDDEFFGMDLSIVREFTDISHLTPIPCCPHHIIGNMNLRGEILTLVDIRNLLNLSQKDMSNKSQAIVVQVDDIVAGIKVEEVVDVMFLNPKEITSIPTALHSFNDEYLQGTAPYRDKMMTILDLPKILLSNALVVEELV
ncbi:chemotaxis protein CheW [Geminocystis sp. GBBB08]|uniref:chemotaxis protein CheW n=1 Tax=Geminocystis sp. GBBB08 TaxID=2604140 RepID=UPI0027E3071F|nr:chemotaxis protein CheW [Geminocystis sp. GBBB08]MBL1208789.1 purine-binding chemotaxis protein CheW [Geminocystis sp. GBBB08]